MQKLATAIVEIIEAMASNFYNGTGDRRILIKQARVQQLEASSSSTTIHEKLDVLAKKMETLMKIHIQMMKLTLTSPICDQYWERGHIGGDCPFAKAMEEVNYARHSIRNNYNPYSNTSNLGWEDHPNLSQGKQKNQSVYKHPSKIKG